MPGVDLWLASFLVPALGEGAAIAATAGLTFRTVIYAGATAYASRQRRKAERNARNAIPDRTIMMRTATASRVIVYGSARVSGPIVWFGTSGQYQEKFHLIVALATACDGVGTIYLDDDRVVSWDANGWAQPSTDFDGKPTHGYSRSWDRVASETLSINQQGKVTLAHTPSATAVVSLAQVLDEGWPAAMYHAGNPATDTRAFSQSGNELTFHASHIGTQVTVTYGWVEVRSYARVKFFDGQPGQLSDPYLNIECPSEWTGARVGNNVAYLSCSFIYDPDVITGGVPNVSAIVRGRRVYDPRTAQTVHTKNVALHVRDYLITEFGCTADEIDDTMLIAAANACDESVIVPGGSQPRYTFNGAIDTAAHRRANLETLLQAMVGTAVYSAGKWRIRAGVWEAPTVSLDEADLAADGGIEIQAFQSRRDLFNGVRGTFTTLEGVVTDFPPYRSVVYEAQDGGEKVFLDLDLPMIDDAYRAQRIAKLMLHKARQALTFTATWNLGAYEVVPGMMVNVSLARFGWDDKPFRCVEREYDPLHGTLRLTFTEEAEAIYAWDYSEATGVDPAPNTNLPDHRFVVTPQLTFASGLQFVTVLADGSRRPFLRVYWQEYDISVQWIELMWKRADAATWKSARVEADDDAFDIYDIAANETYIVAARAVNGANVHSGWAAHSVEVDPNAPANGGNVTLGVGANLLPNATMANTANGWFGTVYDVATVPVVDVPTAIMRDGYPNYAGRVFAGGTFFGSGHRVHPYNAVMLYTSGGASGEVGLLQNDYTKFRLPVTAGDRVEIQTRAGVSNSHASLLLQGFGESGQWVLDMVPSPSPTALSGAGAGNLTLESMTLLYGFVNIPNGVHSVSWALRASRQVSGSTPSFISASMPYLGYAHPGQTVPSEWSVGPSGGMVEGLDAVGTAQILPEAATQVLFASSTGGTISGPSGGPNVSVCSIPISNTSNRDIQFLASASGSARVYFGAVDNPSYATVFLFASASVKIPLTAQTLRIGETTSGNRHETFSLINRGVLAPGQSLTIQLMFARNNKTNLGPTEYAQFDWHETTLRVELIKA